ncbi:hypothetical protein AVEN_134611-1 [Araneus ventricosus]|uniref:Uncharacterized protein n=1 Tax=Araneus ventricosus TaxID=182803 RepID=A0A4Y2NH96_ARAVE|nr:hypothetical protein AVEN_134611-1 [Araneus ventricosus]
MYASVVQWAWGAWLPREFETKETVHCTLARHSPRKSEKAGRGVGDLSESLFAWSVFRRSTCFVGDLLKALNSTRRTVPTTHTQSPTALKNCTEVYVRRLDRHFSGTFEPPHKPSRNNNSLRFHDERQGVLLA